MRPFTPGLNRLCQYVAVLSAFLGLGTHCPTARAESTPILSAPPDPFQQGRNGPTRDVIDEEALRGLAQRATQQAKTTAAKTTPLFGPPPSTQSSLLTSSILISDGEKFTILPIGCVLQLPANLRSHIIKQPQGDVLMWPDFLRKNSAWITSKEVSLPMSRGDAKAAAPILRDVSTETRIVVAVYRNCPITILEQAKASDPRINKAAEHR
jgi:hypothetical protein